MHTKLPFQKSWRAPACLFMLILLAAGVTPATAKSPLPEAAREARTLQIRDFQQTAPGSGWLLMGETLYRTESEGARWLDITPGGAGKMRIHDAVLLDESRGRVLMAAQDAPIGSYSLAHTIDGGDSWGIRELELNALKGLPSSITAVHMDWLDTGFGWIVFKMATGSNFSAGRLFVTLDGGETWQSRSIPIGEPARFINRQVGWVAGGPAGDQLFRTVDGGRTWARQAAASAQAEVVSYSLPEFTDERDGLLPVMRWQGGAASAEIYRTVDGGESWSLKAHQPLAGEVPAARLMAAAFNGGEAVMLLPGSAQLIEMRTGHLQDDDSGNGLANGLIALSMSSMESGWAQRETAVCEVGSDQTCTRQVELLATRDGGAHWQAMNLPGGAGKQLTETFTLTGKSAGSGDLTAAAFADPDTQPFIGHGFDTCQIPSLTQMQTWWNRSPYSAVNLYIGGSARACSNTALSATYLSQLNAQGWRFIPTWVGPQAACSWYSSRMSPDPAIAFEEGLAEAGHALNAALSLGLTTADKSGTVIYYDLEAYNTSDSNCRAAANAFISGWVQRMKARGNLAGVYGASCGSAPTDWNQIPNVPDALWVANWYGNAGEVSFDRTASVFGTYCLSDSLWSNHQRLRQYAGGHNEIWGGLMLNIDSNVLDGPVTVPEGTSNLSQPTRPGLLSPGNGSTLGRTNDTWLAWKTTGATCTVHVWGGSGLDITTPTNCSQFRLGVRPGGKYSWQVTATNGLGSTPGPVWRFNVRPYAARSVQAQALSGTSVKVTWRLSPDEPNHVDGYMIYADGALAGTVSKGVTTFQVNDILCNSQHTFLVRTVRQDVVSGAVPVDVTTPSCAPVLLTPAEGSVTSNLRPRFAWSPLAEATGYQVQVSDTPDFSSLAIDQTVTGSSLSLTADMAADTLFYWRARASGAFGMGDWAGAVSFRTGNPPSVPILLSPGRGEVVTDYTPRLDWQDSSVPAGTSLQYYQVRLSTDSTFKSILYSKRVLVSEFTVPVDLPADATFYWQVRAVNTLGQVSSWSRKWSFSTAAMP